MVYLHGLGPEPAFLPALERLAARYRVIAPDLLGFGESDRPDWLDTTTDYVYHLLDLWDALDLGQAHLVGVSLGGWIAAEFATVASHRLRSLTLVDALGLEVSSAPILDLFALSFEEQVRAMFFHPAQAEPYLQPLDREGQLRRLKGQVTAARVGWNPLLVNPKLRLRLHHIGVPTLVIWGAQDRVAPVEVAEAWHSAIAQARVAILPECGHLPPIEQPEGFCGAVEEFLATV